MINGAEEFKSSKTKILSVSPKEASQMERQSALIFYFQIAQYLLNDRWKNIGSNFSVQNADLRLISGNCQVCRIAIP